MGRVEPIGRSKTWTPLDLIRYEAQNPLGPDRNRVQFTMRRGVIHTYKQLRQPNLVLAASLIPMTLEDPDATFQDWRDLSRRGLPGNLLYTRGIGGPTIKVGSINVQVPKDGDVFAIFSDSEYEIMDYGWLEGSGRCGLPNGHDDRDVIGEMLWTRN